MKHTGATVHPLAEGLEAQHVNSASVQMASATIDYNTAEEESAKPRNIFQRGWDAYVNGLGSGLSSIIHLDRLLVGRTQLDSHSSLHIPEPRTTAVADDALGLGCLL
jgi:hypothetical protein